MKPRRSPLLSRCPARCLALVLGAANALLGLPRVGSLAVAPAAAQPMMFNPAQMSGIPRIEPRDPPARITVRLIRGELTNRVVGTDVQLIDLQKPDAPPRTGKTDPEGRATFADLPPGSYEARAVVDSESKASQPIPLQPGVPGTRVMLVFRKPGAPLPPGSAAAPAAPGAPAAPAAPTAPEPAALPEQGPPVLPSPPSGELGKADNKARTDPGMPPGYVIAKVLDEAGQPLADVPLTLLRAENGKVEPLPAQNSGTDGLVRWSGLRSEPGLVYLVAARHEGINLPSEPFALDAAHGSQVVFLLKPITHDKSALGELKIGRGSHLILDLQDDTIQVMENLRLLNPLAQAIDPGPEGLRVPLAEGAMSPQMVPGGAPNATVDVTKDGAPAVVWKGPIPPGDSELRVGFLLKHRGTLTFRQVVAQPFEELRVVMEKLPGIQFDRVTDLEDRKWQGRDLVLGTVQVPSVGSFIEFTVTGLPAELLTMRYAAAILAVLIALAFAYVALYGKREADRAVQRRRQKLEQKRDALLTELVAAEQREREQEGEASKSKDKTKARPREKTVADLEQIYRHLDELDAS